MVILLLAILIIKITNGESIFTLLNYKLSLPIDLKVSNQIYMTKYILYQYFTGQIYKLHDKFSNEVYL